MQLIGRRHADERPWLDIDPDPGYVESREPDHRLKRVHPDAPRMASGRFAPPPRLVDWSILAAVSLALATGLVGLVTGEPSGAWVFVLHGVGGFALVPLLAWKFRRVAHRLAPGAWDRTTPASAFAAAVVLATLATGIVWVSGGNLVVWRYDALMIHMILGTALVPILFVHLAGRFRLPTRDDVEGRRTALQYAAMAGGGVIAWRLQHAVIGALETAGAGRRFTGSRQERGEGNDFPITMWVADDPDPIDRDQWSLRVDGAVADSLNLTYDELPTGAEREAVLDCTSGWYADRVWTGVRVSDLLDAAGVHDAGRFVSFQSVTGYRWSLPLEEAEAALLATAVGGEPLTHGHGSPLRLVAPGRRGFQWVKWVERIEVRESPDYGQWAAIFTSGFE